MVVESPQDKGIERLAEAGRRRSPRKCLAELGL